MSLYSAEHEAFNDVNWAITMSKLKRLSPRDRASMKKSAAYRALIRDLSLKMTASPELRHFGDVQAVSNIMHAFAVLKVPSAAIAEVLSTVNNNSTWLVESGETKAIACTAWAVAKLNFPAPTLFEKIDEHASSFVDTGDAEIVANMAWAFTAVNIPAPSLFRKIDERLTFFEKNGNPVEIGKYPSLDAENTPTLVAENGPSLVATPTLLSESSGARKSSPREINERILALGSFSNWRDILSVYSAEHEAFNDVNWATTISKLGRVGGKDRTSMKHSEEYAAFIRDLSLKMTASPKLRNFGGVRQVSTIVHALAKLEVPSEDMAEVLSTVNSNSKWLVENGEPQAIANMAWAFAKFDFPAPIFFKKIDERASFLVKKGNPQAIANTTWAFATLNICAPNFFKKIDERPASLVKNGGPQDIANTAWAYATLNIPATDLFKKINEHPTTLKGGPQNIAKTAWAFAALNLPAPTLFEKIDEHASFLVENGSPQDIANMAWAFASLNIPSPTLFKKIDAHAKFLVENGSPQDIENVTWAFNTLDVPGPKLFKKIKERDLRIAFNASPREINKRISKLNRDWQGILSVYSADHEDFNEVNWSTTMNKLGKIFGKDKQLMKQSDTFRTMIRDLSLRMTASPELQHFGGAREVATIAHALAKLKVKSKDVTDILNTVDNNSKWLLETGNPQAIANTAWAFAALNTPAHSLFKRIGERASVLVDQCDPQAIANIAWAFATLNIPSPSLFKKIDERASFLVENGEPQAIANVAWAFAKGSYDAPMLFAAIDSRSKHILDAGNAQTISVTAMAFAELGIRPGSFFSDLEERLGEFLYKYRANEQGICNVCWSLAILDLTHQHEFLLYSLWKRAMGADANVFTVGGLHQLLQVELHAKAGGVVLPAVPPALRQRMLEAATNTDLRSSRIEGEYSGLLTEIGFEHEREVSPFDEDEQVGDVLAIDMACKDRKIAVEYDGSFHFLSSGRENGKTVAKRRLLERVGWKVVNIPYRGYLLVDSQGSEKVSKWELKKNYLRKKLASVGVKL
jgi:hypothetical protein